MQACRAKVLARVRGVQNCSSARRGHGAGCPSTRGLPTQRWPCSFALRSSIACEINWRRRRSFVPLAVRSWGAIEFTRGGPAGSVADVRFDAGALSSLQRMYESADFKLAHMESIRATTPTRAARFQLQRCASCCKINNFTSDLGRNRLVEFGFHTFAVFVTSSAVRAELSPRVGGCLVLLPLRHAEPAGEHMDEDSQGQHGFP